jgi:poly-gamma-glutamate synthesis protein (capsule biosynthesis protein)
MSGKEARPFNFIAAGQALFRRDLQPYEDVEGFPGVLELIRTADLAFTNFEGTIMGAYGGWPTKDRTMVYMEPHTLDTLQWMGFGILSLSNNHSYDLGPNGILSTLEEVERREFLHAGIGRDFTDASCARFAQTKVGQVALIAMDSGPHPDYVYALNANEEHGPRPGNNRQRTLVKDDITIAEPNDAERNLKTISEAASHADFTIAYLHNHYWEKDLEQTSAWTKDLAHQFVDAGANGVAMHGVPMLQGIEIYKGRPLFYGLGNFLFNRIGQPQEWIERMGPRIWDGIIADCQYNADGNLDYIDLVPIVVGGEPQETLPRRPTPLDVPRLATVEQGTRILEHLQKLSASMGTTITITDGRGRISASTDNTEYSSGI